MLAPSFKVICRHILLMCYLAGGNPGLWPRARMQLRGYQPTAFKSIGIQVASLPSFRPGPRLHGAQGGAERAGAGGAGESDSVARRWPATAVQPGAVQEL